MVRSALGKAAWVGRTASMVFGLRVDSAESRCWTCLGNHAASSPDRRRTTS